MRSIKLATTVFALIGAVCLVTGVVWGVREQQFVATAISATGTIVEYERTSGSKGGSSYYPIVRFMTKDNESVEFKSSVGSGSPSYARNAQVPIIYNPTDPKDAQIKDFTSMWLFPLVFSAFGLVFGGIGWGTILWRIRRKRMIQWLKTNGRPLETQYQGVERQSIRVNRVRPYKIVTQWHDPAANKIYLFYSDYIWFDPTEFVKNKTIRVLVDPNNRKKYYVDTSFLPEQL